ncbi:hypothetical protein GCM10007170_41050 [Arthrobacter liuii]|uniref:Secreted protein n=1 Tax=Arthrobacter liuii TaxID=1476996 RepID=A0ABQ2AXR9_9MICC|nr:hypothetical protein GCM10007170_41050 [Arthrobacter liuii]
MFVLRLAVPGAVANPAPTLCEEQPLVGRPQGDTGDPTVPASQANEIPLRLENLPRTQPRRTPPMPFPTCT